MACTNCPYSLGKGCIKVGLMVMRNLLCRCAYFMSISTQLIDLTPPPSLCLIFYTYLCLPDQCVANSCSSSQSGCKILFDSMWTFSQRLLVWFKYSTANISNLWLKGPCSDSLRQCQWEEGMFLWKSAESPPSRIFFKYFANAAPALCCTSFKKSFQEEK